MMHRRVAALLLTLAAIPPVSAELLSKTFGFEPGVVLETLNQSLKEAGLRVGPDPSSGDRCTIGGMIGNNACGSHSVI